MKNKKLYLLFSFLLSILSVGISQKVLENDTFSAIKIGEYIIKHGIDFKEHLNEFNTLNYHNARWLFNVIISFINDHFGFLGIYIFVMLITALIALVLFNILLKNKLNIYISFFITVITIVFTREFFIPRAQLFSYLFLLLEVFFICRILYDNKKLDYIWLFITGVLFANIHTTLWLMSIVVILPFFAEYILSKFKKIEKINLISKSNISLKRLFIITGVVLVTGFVTPIGLIPFTYIFKTVSSLKETITIDEMLPLFLTSTFGAYFIVYVLCLFTMVYKKIKFRISDIFMILGLGVLALETARNLPFFFFITSFIIGRVISECLSKYPDKEEKIMNRLTKMTSITLLITGIILICSSYLFYVNSGREYVSPFYAPVKIADYINDNYDEDVIIFNDFNTGAYLEYRGIKTFIDSRSEIYCKAFNDTTIMKDFKDLSSGNIHYRKIFDKYNVKLVIVYNDAGIDIYLKEDKNYKKILKDDHYTLYEKIQ